MLCLGIESTAHTFGAAVVSDKGKILSNVKDSYTTKKGGIVPNHAAEHHINVCDKVIGKALETANAAIKDIDIISYSKSPGIGHCLRIGAMCTRCLSVLHKIPFVGVNHCVAHLEIGKLVTKAKDPVLLYVSGANTQVIAFDAGNYRIFGETLDIGIGNFLDSFARFIGLGFPGGPEVYELAEKGKNYIELPYSVKGMDISFGGVLTNLKHKVNSGKYSKTDLAYSVQETVFAMLIEVAERAMHHCKKNELLLGGGVACNNRLKQMAEQMCNDNGFECFVPEKSLLVDNAAMIAWLGIKNKKYSSYKIEDATIDPYERTDETTV